MNIFINKAKIELNILYIIDFSKKVIILEIDISNY